MKGILIFLWYQILPVLCLVGLSFFPLRSFAQETPGDSLKKVPVVVEAESGRAGSGILAAQDGDIRYITAKTTYTGQSGPGDSTRVVTCTLTFKDTRYYQLFVRMRVGPGGYDDDSFFPAKGFGEKVPAQSNDWVFINGLASAGFSASSDVEEEMGAAGSQIWKWVNISLNFFPAATAKTTSRVDAGIYSVIWEPESTHNSALKSGIYSCQLVAGQNSISKKMMYLK